MLIRRANPSDAEELAILAERTFRKTFRRVILRRIWNFTARQAIQQISS
jgi:hypothetical protein